MRNEEQNQRIRDERREQILSHAMRLFAAKGLSATKITDIAAQAKMSQGLLYHYFHSKEEIFSAIIRMAFEKMNTAARGLEELALAPDKKIRLAISQLLRSIEESEDFAATVLLIAQAGISEDTPPDAQEIIRKERGIPYEVITRIMQAGQQDGSIKPYDADALSIVFWTTIKGLALHKAVNGTTFKSPDARILYSMFFTSESQGDTHA
ncbi:MAG TPA: TetR/AcrR family transcriptional regulator [Armatimonadota bacterium]|nr:TetR/AcrR family transcriptional regulator [Armatimonadota bacterium]